jgi:hypothetical protein
LKGRLVTQCCACGIAKGVRDSNTGWWVLTPRGLPALARDFCPACAPGLLVRADEVQSNPRAMHGLRIVSAQWLRGMLYVLKMAGVDWPGLRETLGWRLAEKVAQLIDFEDLPKALPCREFGFIPEETP